MKILFIGCVESSYVLLKRLLEEEVNVAGVLTKKSSRFNADFYDLAPVCDEYGIPYHYVEDVNSAASIHFIENCSADIAFCFGWSQLLKEDVINLFPKGAVGFHPAELPNNRGRHPIIWALALGLPETASTFFMLTPGADEGNIVSQQKIQIAYSDDARSLYNKIMEAAVEQEIELVRAFKEDKIRYISQSAEEGNVWRKRSRTDGEIDWRMSSRSIYNLVRSLTRPYAGAHFMLNGSEYKVWKTQEIETAGFENFEPGKVLAVNGDGTVDVKAGENGVRLVEFDAVNIENGGYLL